MTRVTTAPGRQTPPTQPTSRRALLAGVALPCLLAPLPLWAADGTDIALPSSSNAATVSGNNGGGGYNGGAGPDSSTPGGTGGTGGNAGAGGNGGNLTLPNGSTFSNTGTIQGGNGGAGGIGGQGGDGGMGSPGFGGPGGRGGDGGRGGNGGSGGNGGTGIVSSGSTLTNTGTIRGGNGGTAGWGGGGGDPGMGGHGSGGGGTGPTGGFGPPGFSGASGNGGNAITGSGLSVINSGTIAGGNAGGGGTNGYAIRFTGGINSLTLEAGSTITGTVAVTGGTGTLALGGAGTASFDASKIGSQYIGFTAFQKTGAGTWTLTGTTAATTPWTIAGGTLAVSTDAAFGDASQGLALSGGTLQWGAAFNSARAVTLASGGGTVDTNGVNASLSGVISGSGGLTKTGAGTLTLAAAETYTGGTEIVAGMLAAGAANVLGAAGPTTVDRGATLDLGGYWQSLASLYGSGTVTNSGTSVVALSIGSGAFGGVLQDGAKSLALTKTGNGILTLSGANTYSGYTEIDGGTLGAGALNAFSPNSGIIMAASAILDLGGYDQSVPTLAGTGTVTNSGSAPAILSVGKDNAALTFSGILQDGATSSLGLTKTGTGILRVSGANSYSGATTVAAGTLQAVTPNALSPNSATTVAGGATLAFGFNQSIASLAGAGTVTTTAGVSATLSVGAGNSSTVFSGVLQDGLGHLTLAKTGSGTLTLDGVNTAGGGTTISAGTLAVGDAAHASASLAGAVTVGGGTLAGHGAVGGAVTNNGGTVAPGGSIGTLTVGSYTQGTGGTLAIEVSPGAASELNVLGTASLAGTLSLSFDGGSYGSHSYDILHAAGGLTGSFTTVLGSAPAGTSTQVSYTGTDVNLTLSLLAPVPPPAPAVPGANGAAGIVGLTVNGGGAYLNSGVLAGTAGGNGGAGQNGGTGGNGGAGGAGLVFTAGGSLDNTGSILGGTGGTAGTPGGTAGAGGAGIVGAGLAIVNAGSIAGAAGAPAIRFTGGTNSLTLEAGSAITGAVLASSSADSLILGGATGAGFDVSQIGSQYQGFGVFQKTGAGTWTLTGTTAAATPWTIAGGTLRVSSDGALGAASAGLTLSGGTLQWGAAVASARAVTLSGAGGTVDTNGNDATLSGPVSGSGGLTKTGAGTLTLAAAETYTGTTTVTGGILRLAGGSRLAGGALAVTGGGVDLNGQTQTVGALSGGAGGAITLGGGILTVDQAGDSTFGGVLSGAGSLIKTGSGRLTLTGTNSASGGVAVDGGTLAVGDAANPGASIASATVAAGATLTGTGTIGGDVANAGILAPSGTLAIGGSYRQASSGRLVIEVSPSTASQVRLGGAAHLAGTLTLAYDPGVYTTRRYTIVEAASVDGGFGTITGTAPAGTRQTLGYSANAVTLTLTGATTTVAPTVTGVVPAIGIAMLTNGQSANTLLFSHLAERQGGGGTDTATPSLAQLAFAGDDRDLGQILAGLPQAVAALGGWMRVTGGTGSVDGASGYGTSGGGFLAGVDRQATEHLIVGVAAGYSRNRLYAHDGGHGTLDSPRLSVYGSYGLDPRWSADASLGYAFDSISSRRATALGIAGASHSGHEGSAQAELRGTLPAATVDLIPTVGVRYVVLAEQGYSESGALGNDLTVASALHQSAQPFAGLAVTRRFTADDGTRWTPEAALEAARELVPSGAAALTAGNGAFTASPTAPSRDRLTAGLALDVSLDGSLAGRIAYQALLPTGNAVTHTVSAGLRYQF